MNREPSFMDRFTDWVVSDRPTTVIPLALIAVPLIIGMFFLAGLPFIFDWPDWVKGFWLWNIFFG